MSVTRKTKSVKRLMQTFAQTDAALSVVELVERYAPEMNKTTVYRILERLEGEGILHSFTGQGGLKFYARCNGCDSQHHHDVHPHFQCRDCGKSECLSIEFPIPPIPNHKIDSAELLLIGQCAACRA